MYDNMEENKVANVLIVDDDRDACRMLDIIFSKNGFHPIVVCSGQEAIEVIKDRSPDVVILDVMMPQMDGWETFDQIRQLSGIPVLFLTAVCSVDAVEQALDNGVNDYLRKPFFPKELVARTRALLRNNRSKLSSITPNIEHNCRQWRPTVSVIIPTLNEAENLPHVLPYLPFDMIDEIILVDGHSTDGTVETARNLLPYIKVINEKKLGKGAALRTGIAAATGDIIITLDADGSTDPSEMPVFIGALRSGADFVKGSRFVQGAGTLDMPLYRQIGNKALVLAANLFFKAHYTDITYGYNATWRRYANSLALDIDGWACEIISNIRAISNGLRVVEVASLEHERINGNGKLHAFSAGWTILKAMIAERFKRTDNDVTHKIWSPSNMSDILNSNHGHNQNSKGG
jgi:CheY-like chemotaxis protein